MNLYNDVRSLALLCAALSCGLLVFDVLLPLGVAGGVPYVMVILLALRADDDRLPLGFAVCTSLLVLVGMLLSEPQGLSWVAATNRALALFAIWVTALLGLQVKRVSRFSRANRALLIELVARLPLGIAAIDPAGCRYEYANQAYATLFDKLPGDLLEQPLEACHDAEFMAHFCARCSAMMDGGSTTFEHELPVPVADGSHGRRLTVQLAQFQDEEMTGAPLIVAVVSDISAIARAAEQLQRQQSELAHVARVSTMGELAAKLAHELNQPLCAISSYTRASLRMMRSGQWHEAELIDALEDASQQAERAADIIRGMRNFLRKRPDGRRTFDIAQLAREVIALVQADARRERVTIQFDIPDALPGVHADRTEINQVLFNLLSNAIEACAEHAAGERRVVLAAALTPGHAVEVQVADTGAGFVDGVAEHLFDPFFSTKQEGMGMGLSICRTIVEAHGGVLRARNNSQGGATFTFELPVDGEELHDVA